MNQEVVIGLGLLAIAYAWFFSDNSTPQIQTDDSNYLMDKYGLTETECRTFSYIADPIKRDQYLNYVIRSKQKY